MVTPPDVEAWIIPYLAALLADVDGLEITNAEPPDQYLGDHPLVLVQDLPGACLQRVTYDWTLAVTVRWGARQDPGACKQLANRIMGLLTDDPTIQLAEGSPICEVVDGSSTGPTFVTEDHDTARYYLTVDYTVAGVIQ